jgi:hypothetical protein
LLIEDAGEYCWVGVDWPDREDVEPDEEGSEEEGICVVGEAVTVDIVAGDGTEEDEGSKDSTTTVVGNASEPVLLMLLLLLKLLVVYFDGGICPLFASVCKVGSEFEGLSTIC